jgi:hypothetical protein
MSTVARPIADNDEVLHAMPPATTPPSDLLPLDHGPDCRSGRPLTATDATDIWIARWLRVPVIAMVRRYGCDPRRLYEIWGEEKFIGSRRRALDIFLARHPELVGRVDTGRHTRIPKAPPPSQLTLFD